MEIIKNIVLRPTYVEVDLKLLRNNYNFIKERANKSIIMPILKANAYGHGMVQVAKFLENEGAEIFGVAFLEEGILLRKEGIKSDILVLGGLSGYQVDYFIEYNLIITASSIEKLNIIDKRAKELNKKARVHLKIDTGMERIGVHHYNSKKFFEVSLEKKNISIEGVYSHFANSDHEDAELTYKQFNYFIEAIKYFEEKNYKLIRHIANSGAILRFPIMHLDMVRAGIVLYGYMPARSMIKPKEIKPILSLKSKVVYFKVVPKGAKISYSSTWTADKITRIITIPIGYGDGYPRALSNKGMVIINNKKYPIVGRVCMDQLMVNISQDEVYNQDEVILIGKSKDCKIDCDDIAKISNTISYEILTMINQRVPKIYLY